MPAKAKKSKEKNNIYQLIFENFPQGVAVYSSPDKGKSFVFVDYNKVAEKLDGIKKEELIGKDLLKVFPGAEEMGLCDTLRQVYKTGKTSILSEKEYQDGKKSFWRDNYLFKMEDKIVVVYADVSERVKEKNLLEEKIEELEKLSKLTMHRELKMVGLKEKIKILENKK